MCRCLFKNTQLICVCLMSKCCTGPPPPKHFKLHKFIKFRIKVQTKCGQTACLSVCLFVSVPVVWFSSELFFHVFEACLISLSFSVFVFYLCFSKGDGSCVPISHEKKGAKSERRRRRKKSCPLHCGFN